MFDRDIIASLFKGNLGKQVGQPGKLPTGLDLQRQGTMTHLDELT